MFIRTGCPARFAVDMNGILLGFVNGGLRQPVQTRPRTFVNLHRVDLSPRGRRKKVFPSQKQDAKSSSQNFLSPEALSARPNHQRPSLKKNYFPTLLNHRGQSLLRTCRHKVNIQPVPGRLCCSGFRIAGKVLNVLGPRNIPNAPTPAQFSSAGRGFTKTQFISSGSQI